MTYAERIRIFRDELCDLDDQYVEAFRIGNFDLCDNIRARIDNVESQYFDLLETEFGATQSMERGYECW